MLHMDNSQKTQFLMNEAKIILDLCGGTGAWSKPYLDANYDVRNITLPEYDVRDFIPPENVYGILAAPPCTMFSLARTRAKIPRNFKEGLSLVDACLRIIWYCKPHFWALENPVGLLRRWLGIPKFTFDPCDFGDPWTKKTDLWGNFNIPRKKPIVLTREERYKWSQNNWKLPSISNFTGSKQTAKRAITPSGFAQAFFEANP